MKVSGNSSGTRELNHIYVYGLELIGQTRSYIVNFQSGTQQIYYDYDGHGPVRALTDPNGNVTDSYDYDAFGNLIHSLSALCLNSSGTITMVALGSACPTGFSQAPTPNNYLFAGEQFDSDLNLYYSRARYLNVSTGRFWTWTIRMATMMNRCHYTDIFTPGTTRLTASIPPATILVCRRCLPLSEL